MPSQKKEDKKPVIVIVEESETERSCSDIYRSDMENFIYLPKCFAITRCIKGQRLPIKNSVMDMLEKKR